MNLFFLRRLFLLIAVAALLGAAHAGEPRRRGEPRNAGLTLADFGTEFPVAYEKYGTFTGLGANEYRYKIVDRNGLARAIGEGIYPNGVSLPRDPSYKRWKASHAPQENPWDHVQSGDPKTDFYVWATARDVGPGAKLLFTGQALDDAGFPKQALKAYYAIVVNFPKEACWSGDHAFVWYVGDAALGRIESILERHPEIGWRLDGAEIKVFNGTDTDLNNDRFIISPGVWTRAPAVKAPNLATLKVIHQRGYGKVQLFQYENKQWQLRVDGKPFIVRGLTYAPTTVGQHISAAGNHWMKDDTDENGKPDAPYDSWVDENHNGKQDANEPAVGDFELMRRMGCNTIRLYRSSTATEYDSSEFDKDVLRDLTNKYGIRCIMGDFLGAYTVGSGAAWETGTDYTDPVQLENMRRLVKSYVMDHRSEPYVLLWLLGNENLMPADYSGVNATRTRASRQVEAYLKFVNEIAQMIHQIDPDHPVAVGNLDALNLDEHAKFAPDVDIFGANSYRGSTGFGTLWKTVANAYDRPVLITEFGCDAWDSRKNQEDEEGQAAYHEGNWLDIERHEAGGIREGNAIGGVIFEYLDEWWKSPNGSWDTHETTKDSAMAYPDGWSSEEWDGIISQGEGNESPFLRQPRKAYYLYRDRLWKNQE